MLSLFVNLCFVCGKAIHMDANSPYRRRKTSLTSSKSSRSQSRTCRKRCRHAHRRHRRRLAKPQNSLYRRRCRKTSSRRANTTRESSRLQQDAAETKQGKSQKPW